MHENVNDELGENGKIRIKLTRAIISFAKQHSTL